MGLIICYIMLSSSGDLLVQTLKCWAFVRLICECLSTMLVCVATMFLKLSKTKVSCEKSLVSFLMVHSYLGTQRGI
jgi:hypothetical protein